MTDLIRPGDRFEPRFVVLGSDRYEVVSVGKQSNVKVKPQIDDYWPTSDWQCPNCGRFVGNRWVYIRGELGSATGTCSRCGDVECRVVGWVDGEGNFS